MWVELTIDDSTFFADRTHYRQLGLGVGGGQMRGAVRRGRNKTDPHAIGKPAALQSGWPSVALSHDFSGSLHIANSGRRRLS